MTSFLKFPNMKLAFRANRAVPAALCDRTFYPLNVHCFLGPKQSGLCVSLTGERTSSCEQVEGVRGAGWSQVPCLPTLQRRWGGSLTHLRGFLIVCPLQTKPGKTRERTALLFLACSSLCETEPVMNENLDNKQPHLNLVTLKLRPMTDVQLWSSWTIRTHRREGEVWFHAFGRLCWIRQFPRGYSKTGVHPCFAQSLSALPQATPWSFPPPC